METKVIRTLGQKRSEFALKKISNNLDLKKLKHFSAGIPSMILQNGLGHSLAFCYSKGQEQHFAILQIVEEWIGNENPQFKKLFQGKKDKEFLITLSRVDQKVYLAVQEEVLALLEWVKRYANAFIKDEGSVK